MILVDKHLLLNVTKKSSNSALAYGAIDDYLKTLADDSKRTEVQQLRAELGQLRKDNERLRRSEELTKSSLEDTAATEAHLKASLQKAFTDVVGGNSGDYPYVFGHPYFSSK